jgi:class 3 adenylate cyclase
MWESLDFSLSQIMVRAYLSQATPQTVEPELYSSASVSFVDIVSFTNLSSVSTPFEIIRMLNELFSLFDAIVAVGATGVLYSNHRVIPIDKRAP